MWVLVVTVYWCIHGSMNDFRLNYIIAKLPDVRFSSGNTLSPYQHNLQYVTSESSGESLALLDSGILS
jgi:hypothetical protein